MHLRNKLLVSAMILSFPIATVASADESGLYVGLGGGWNNFMHEKDNVSRAVGGPTFRRFNLEDHDQGFAISGQIGYKTKFDTRFEFETTYRYNSLPNAISGQPQNEDNSLAFMANVIYDIDLEDLFKVDTKFTPYLGIGVGAARLESITRIPGILRPDITLDYSGKEWALAYQGIAGISYEVNDAITVGVDYRYFSADRGVSDLRVTIPGSDTRTVKLDRALQNHSVMASIRYSFGGPAAPAAKPTPTPAVAAAPAATPPAPPPATPRVQTFLVFFDWDSAQLTTAARDTITAAAQAIKSGNVARLEIVGHTDTTGSPQYNHRLGSRRADAVRDELTKKGVAHGAITTRSAGKTQLRVPTADNVREPQNRRAEIILPPS